MNRFIWVLVLFAGISAGELGQLSWPINWIVSWLSFNSLHSFSSSNTRSRAREPDVFGIRQIYSKYVIQLDQRKISKTFESVY